MKKNLYVRRVGSIAVIVGLLLAIMLAVGQFVHPSLDEFPKINFPKAGNQENMENILNLDNLKLPSDNVAAVYRIKTIDTLQDQANIRDSLSLDDAAVFGTLSDPNPIASSAVIGYDSNSGRWLYQTDMAFDTGENVPNEQEAIRIARDFISTSNLYPVELLGDPVVAADTSGDGLEEERTVLRRSVYYYPTMDNNPVYGVFRICIEVGSNGEIVGVEKLASEYEKVTDVQLSDLQSVKKDFATQDFMYMGEDTPQYTELEQAEVGFYADVESEYIQPVYIISNADESAAILIDALNRD